MLMAMQQEFAQGQVSDAASLALGHRVHADDGFGIVVGDLCQISEFAVHRALVRK